MDQKSSSEDQSSQLASFLKTFGGRTTTSVGPPAKEEKKKIPFGNSTFGSNFTGLSDSMTVEASIYGGDDQSSGTQMQLTHMESLIQMKSQQIERLQAEVKTLVRIQNDQAIALEMALQDRRELEKQLAQLQTGLPTIAGPAPVQEEAKNPFANKQKPSSAMIQNKETPYFLENSMFLRAFLRSDQASIEELVKSIGSIADQHTRGLAGQALFSQMQRYMQLNSIFERLTDEMGTDNFITTFEQNVRNLIDSRRIILWARIPSAKVIVSRTASLIVPEGEGLLGKCVLQGQRLVLTDPSRDPSYSMDYDGSVLSNARVVLYQPVISSKKEVLWIIQIVDRLSAKGTVVTPTGDDFLILDFLSLSLLRLYQEESRVDELIKRILTESTRSLLIERQVMPLLETVQLTVTHIVGCESLQIFFADPNKDILFQLKEGAQAGSGEMNISSVIRDDYPVDKAGIAGVAFKNKKIVNVAVAKEHAGFNQEIDGDFASGSCLAVPLLSSKGAVSLVAVARQKKSGMMFTSSDEIILEALSRVSQGALSNAQSHERNIAEIQRALNNHKYYTALLAVAQELSAVLDTDTLVRKIMTKAQSFIGADRCSLFLVDKERGGLWSMVAHGATDRIYIPEGYGIAGAVAKTGETLNIPDAYSDPRFNSSVDKTTGYKTKSILCVAIRASDGIIIGCTQMINKLGAPEFSQTDVELMTAFNVFCGIALSNAQLFEAATKSKKKMTAMLDIALSLSTSTTLDALVTNIMGRAQELIEAENAYLFVIDRIHHKCRPLGNSSSPVKEFSIKNDAVGFIALTGSELNIENMSSEKRFQEYYPDSTAKQLLALPILDASGQVVGVAKAINKMNMPRFSSEDQALLRAFASFAGLAIDRWMAKRPGDFGQSEIDLIETLSPTELNAIEPSDRLKVFDPLATAISSHFFDVFMYQRNEQFRILLHFFTELGIIKQFNIPVGTLLRFLRSAAERYQNLPFHDWNQAVAVTQHIFWILSIERFHKHFSKLELFALLVSSICHDMGHNGRSGIYNQKAQTPLAILYKDQPVMETFHCSATISLLSQPSCNILSNMDSGLLKEFWSLTFDLILATDSAQHSRLIDEMQLKLNQSFQYDISQPLNRVLLLKLVLKCGLITNVARPFEITQPWSTHICESCAIDSEQSKGIGLSTQTQFITSQGIAKRQIKALSESCIPLVNVLLRAVPQMHPLSDQIRLNLQTWTKFDQENK